MIQSNIKGGKCEIVHSSTTRKSCKENTLVTYKDPGNLKHDFKWEAIYSESLGKPGQQNSTINHKKYFKKESVKNIDCSVSWVSTISENQNTAKGIESNKKKITI